MIQEPRRLLTAVGLVLVISIVAVGCSVGRDADEKLAEVKAEVADTTTTTRLATSTTRPPTTTTTRAPTTTTTQAPTTTTTAPPPPPPADPFAGETVSQRNARQKAADYLDFSAFSRSGLIEQLEYEGFNTADATYGVDALNVDWNEQAAKKAADYLEFSAFSRSGLVDQLLYEGFTQEQAEYGVSTTGL